MDGRSSYRRLGGPRSARRDRPLIAQCGRPRRLRRPRRRHRSVGRPCQRWYVSGSASLAHLATGLDAVDNVLSLAKPGGGRPSAKDRSLFVASVALSCAVWENFAEDVVVEAVTFAAHDMEPEDVPQAAEEFIAKGATTWQLAVHRGGVSCGSIASRFVPRATRTPTTSSVVNRRHETRPSVGHGGRARPATKPRGEQAGLSLLPEPYRGGWHDEQASHRVAAPQQRYDHHHHSGRVCQTEQDHAESIRRWKAGVKTSLALRRSRSHRCGLNH